MIDPKDLADGIAHFESCVAAVSPFSRPSRTADAILAAAKAYLSAVASKDEVEAAIKGYCTDSAGDSHRVAMHAALTAAKIKARSVSFSAELAVFISGRKIGWNEARGACIKSMDDLLAMARSMGDYEAASTLQSAASTIGDLNPPGD